MSKIKILHLSDTHFGAHDDLKRSAVIQFTEEWRPDIIALTGDIVDSPLRKNFALAQAFINALRTVTAEVHAVPGNHDALFGRIGLGTFWQKIQELHPESRYVRYKTIKGQNIYLIGVDTTHLSMRELNNAGRFDRGQENFLSNELSRLRTQHGAELDRSIKIILVHHHPIPTVVSEAEWMLYFKNAGRFLRFAVKYDVRLILHGHQHDPHFAKVCFGSDRDDEIIAVLSAGSCLKNTQIEPDKPSGHFYAISIDSERAIVTSYYCHGQQKIFRPLDDFAISRVATTTPMMRTLDHKFTITSEGHMRTTEENSYE